MFAQLDPNERLAWDHALHEERVLNERAGLFLVAEAMLLVFYATIAPHASPGALRIFAATGLVLTIGWLLLNVRQRDDLAQATATLKAASPFYATYLANRSADGLRFIDVLVLVFGLPVLVAVVWLTLLCLGSGILGL